MGIKTLSASGSPVYFFFIEVRSTESSMEDDGVAMMPIYPGRLRRGYYECAMYLFRIGLLRIFAFIFASLVTSSLNAEKWINYTDATRINALEVDDRYIWQGTAGGMVKRSLKNPETDVEYYTRADGLAFNYVSAVSIDRQGNKWFATYHGGVSVLVDATHDEADTNPQVRRTFVLDPPYPNPLNPTTTIEYDLPRAGHVSLIIYNLLGRKVKVAVSSWQEAGKHSVTWNASTVPSGIYFVRMKSGEFSQVRKVVLLK